MKRRQRVRRALTFVSFLLFPVTLYWFSPFLVVFAASQGVAAGSLLVFAAMLLTAPLLGRAWCGWACPGHGLQQACLAVGGRRAPAGRWAWTKYVLWLPWVAGIGLAIASAGGISRVEPTFQTAHGLSVVDLPGLIVYVSMVALIAVVAFAARRFGFCHHVCWMAPFLVVGARVGRALRVPVLQLRAAPERCTACGTCTRECPMSLPVAELVAAGTLRHSDCILCGTCADGCPNGTIRFAFGRPGRAQ